MFRQLTLVLGVLALVMTAISVQAAQPAKAPAAKAPAAEPAKAPEAKAPTKAPEAAPAPAVAPAAAPTARGELDGVNFPVDVKVKDKVESETLAFVAGTISCPTLKSHGVDKLPYTTKQEGETTLVEAKSDTATLTATVKAAHLDGKFQVKKGSETIEGTFATKATAPTAPKAMAPAAPKAPAAPATPKAPAPKAPGK